MAGKENKAADMLKGINEISRHAKRDLHTIIDWHQSWVNCPIKRTDTGLECSIKKLDKWMSELGLNRPKQKKF